MGQEDDIFLDEMGDESEASAARSKRVQRENAARAEYVQAFTRVWYSRRPHHRVPQGWRRSVWEMHDRGLEVNVMTDFASRVLENEGVAPVEKFRYFMGMCWERLRQDGKVPAKGKP